MSATSAERPSVPTAKRILDLALTVPLLVLLSPLMVLIAIAVRIDSPGPALFRQERIGHGQRPFVVLKYRTMRSDASEELHEQYVKALLREKSAGAGGGAMFKLEDDPRVTRVGALLRRTSLDELPQLLNVLRGEMSLVGPRPELTYMITSYEPWQLERFDVPPGMTGLWQVSGRGELPPAEMLRLDVEYARRRTLALDLQILARTVPAVLGRRGSA